jgi:hypothetical protein
MYGFAFAALFLPWLVGLVYAGIAAVVVPIVCSMDECRLESGLETAPWGALFGGWAVVSGGGWGYVAVRSRFRAAAAGLGFGVLALLAAILTLDVSFGGPALDALRGDGLLGFSGYRRGSEARELALTTAGVSAAFGLLALAFAWKGGAFDGRDRGSTTRDLRTARTAMWLGAASIVLVAPRLIGIPALGPPNSSSEAWPVLSGDGDTLVVTRRSVGLCSPALGPVAADQRDSEALGVPGHGPARGAVSDDGSIVVYESDGRILVERVDDGWRPSTAGRQATSPALPPRYRRFAPSLSTT